MTTQQNKFEEVEAKFSAEFSASSSSKGSVKVRYTDGSEESYSSLKALQKSDGFADLMKRVEGGEVFSIDFPVRSFVMGKNQKNIRLRDGDLNKVAQKTDGTPMIMDHVGLSMSEVGIAKESSMSRFGGKDSMETTLSARDPKFQERFLRGMHRKYSVQFEPDGYVACSACGQHGRMTSYGSMYLSCGHFRGEKIKNGEHKGKMVEMVFGASGLKEISATPIPAVKSAGALGQSFSSLQPEGEKMDEVQAKLSEITAERDQLKAEIVKKDETIAKLNTEVGEWKEQCFSTVIDSLRETDHIGNDPEELEDARALFSQRGADRVLAFYRKNPPRLNISTQSAGAESANQVPKDSTIIGAPKEEKPAFSANVGGKKVTSLVDAVDALEGPVYGGK